MNIWEARAERYLKLVGACILAYSLMLGVAQIAFTLSDALR